jgi:membrane protein implicated in regulation of membrane protease activity
MVLQMQYFGIPTCPYCKKRVNLIRVWSLKKHGEYMCPRCKGISNIYLSPLVYVFAVLAISAGFLIYFFEKFIMDSIDMTTALWVLLPFALFFLLSLFFVYLQKPVIKKVRRTPDGRFFDEQGNELKMKMGKLVPVDGGSKTQNTQGFYRQDDNLNAPERYGEYRRPAAPTGEREPAEPSRVIRQDTAPAESHAPAPLTQADFLDDEDLYAQAASRIHAQNPERDYTVRLNKEEILHQSEKDQAEEIQAEVSDKQKKQHAPREKIEFENPIPVGKVAQERAEGSPPNSGFEDLFASYGSQAESRRTAARTGERRRQPSTPAGTGERRRESAGRDLNREETREQPSARRSRGGSRFRDL